MGKDSHLIIQVKRLVNLSMEEAVMRKNKGCKLFTAIVAFVMMASLSMGQQDFRYRLSGDWFNLRMSTDDSGWYEPGTLVPLAPGVADNARINWGGNTVTLTNGAVVVGGMQSGWDSPGTLLIGAGGDLSTSLSVVTNNSVIGFNNVGVLTVETGGSALFRSDFLVGQQASGVGTVNINGGTITVDGEFRAGDLGTGSIFVNEGGTLNLSGLATNGIDSIRVGSKLDIVGTGQVIISGDAEDTVNLYVANGTLLGNGVSNNVIVQVTFGAETNTTITAIVVVPNVVGSFLGSATNAIQNLGYVTGTVVDGYEPGVLSGAVIGQDPLGGSSAAPGTVVNLIIQEPFLPVSVQENTWWGPTSGDWLAATNWSAGVAPIRETQNYSVRLRLGPIVTLTNSIRVSSLEVGTRATPGTRLTISNGGSLIGGGRANGGTIHCSFGVSAETVVTVQTNSLLQTQSFAILGHGIGTPTDYTVTLNIDGGSFISKDWMGVGYLSKQIWGVINVDNGGYFEVLRFHDGRDGAGNSTNGVINLNHGTMVMNGNATNFINGAIANGFIAPNPDTPYTLDYNVTTAGKTTLRLIPASYTAWAETWGVDIGSETDDYDNDQADNLWEYAANGNPTNAQDTGVAPVLANDAGVLTYTHLVRADDLNLVYTVQTTGILTPANWVDTGSTVIGTEVSGGDYNTVTNLVSPVAVDQSFLRVEVDNP